MTIVAPLISWMLSLPAPMRGAIWAAFSMAVFSFVPVSVRYLSDTMPSTEIVFFRSLLGLSIMSVYFSWAGFRQLATRRLGQHVVRSLFNYVGMVMWFYALGRMPFADAVAIHFSLPLFVVLLAVIFLGERVGMRRSIATIVGFLGVLVVLRPGVEAISLAAIGVIASALLYAGAVVMIKKLVRTETAAAVNFYTNFFMLLLALIPTGHAWAMPTWDDVPALLLLGIAGTAAPYMFARALTVSDASMIAPLDFLRLPFTAMTGFLFFGETTVIWTWAGAAIIFGSATYITRREARLARAPPEQPTRPVEKEPR